LIALEIHQKNIEISEVYDKIGVLVKSEVDSETDEFNLKNIIKGSVEIFEMMNDNQNT